LAGIAAACAEDSIKHAAAAANVQTTTARIGALLFL
jgi:hypothetical protein